MIPDDEIAKVLEMVRDGTITPEQGAELISAIKDSEHGGNRPSGGPQVKGRSLDEFIEEAVESAVQGSLEWVNRYVGEVGAPPKGRRPSAGRFERASETLLRHTLGDDVRTLELDVEVASASLTFSAHAGRDLAVRYSGPPQEAPEVTFKGRRLQIEHAHPFRIFGNRWGWDNPSIEVDVPQDISLAGSVELSNGRLDVRRLNLRGLSAETGNGAIAISSSKTVEGTSLETRNGTVLVAAEEIQGLSIEALNGKVDVAGIIRGTDIETTNGRIFVQPFPGSRGRLSAEASRGAILVRVPRDLGFDLDAESSMGTVRVNVHDMVRGTSGFANELHASRGDGALHLELETSAGTITVEEAAD